MSAAYSRDFTVTTVAYRRGRIIWLMFVVGNFHSITRLENQHWTDPEFDRNHLCCSLILAFFYHLCYLLVVHFIYLFFSFFHWWLDSCM